MQVAFCLPSGSRINKQYVGRIKVDVVSMKEKKTSRIDLLSFVPLTEPFSNSFMDDLDLIWRLKTIIPDPTTPPVLFRKSDVGDVD